MNIITIDFNKYQVCVQTSSLREKGVWVRLNCSLNKRAFRSFIPEEFQEFDYFAWDFEKESLIVNETISISMLGLANRYEEFLMVAPYSNSEISFQVALILAATFSRIF